MIVDSIMWQASVIHVLLVLLELISESNDHVFKLSSSLKGPPIYCNLVVSWGLATTSHSLCLKVMAKLK